MLFSFKKFILFLLPVCMGMLIEKALYIQTSVFLENILCIQGQYYNFLKSTPVFSFLKCALECSKSSDCRRFMFDRKTKICSLFESGENCLTDENIEDKICFRQLFICSDVNCSRCPIGYYGNRCQYIIQDCTEGVSREVVRSGSLTSYIRPSMTGPVLEVHCEFNPSGATSIQRRNNRCTEVNFNRTYMEYVHGFGDIHNEYWLGLKNIFNILQTHPQYELDIRLTSRGGVYRASYASVNITDETDRFRFFAGAFQTVPWLAGDSLTQNPYSINGRPFSVYDRDYTSFNCPERYGGGWWFLNDSVCSRANPNGERSGINFERSIHWADDLGDKTNFNIIRIRLIRPQEIL